MTDVQNLFIGADKHLASIIAQIKPDQWSMIMPDWFQAGAGQHDLSLRAVINYHAYDEAWVPATLSGQAVNDTTGVPADKEADLLGDNPSASYNALMAKAVDAVAALKNLEENVHLSYGDWPAGEYLKHITSFRLFRSYDLAKLIGVDTTWPNELVTGATKVLEPHFDEWRQWGVYRPAVPVPPGASRQDELILGSGRQL